MHHIVAYCLVMIVFDVFFVVGSASEDIHEYPTEGQYPYTTPSGKQNPLVHSDTIPLSLSPTPFYCIRTTTIQLLHAVVVEPLSSA